MLSSPSFSLCQMPGYLVSMAAKSGTSDTSKMMEQSLTPRLSDRVRSEKLERCFIVEGMTQETKQFFIKDYFKRLVIDSMDTAVNPVVNSATEKIIAWDDKRFTEEVLEPKNKLVKPMQLSCNKVASDVAISAS